MNQISHKMGDLRVESVKQAAEVIGVTPTRIYKLIEDGRLNTHFEDGMKWVKCDEQFRTCLVQHLGWKRRWVPIEPFDSTDADCL